MFSRPTSKWYHRLSLNPAVARARTAARARGRRTDEGVTLIEVLVAFVLLMVVILPMAYLLDSTASSAANARQREAAVELADSWIEILSNSSPPTNTSGAVITNTPATPVAPSGAQTPKSTLAGTTFTVTANYTLNSVDTTGQSDLCSDGEPPSPSHPGVIELQVVVTWDSGRQSLTDSTNIDYPQPGVQTQGFLAVQLSNDGETDVHGNSAATRLSAIPVTIDETSSDPTLSPNPMTLHSDQNGCVFAQVPTGTYSVSLGQPTLAGYGGSPPFVTTTGATTDSATNQVVTVTAEQVVQLSAFDEGIDGTVSYGGAAAVDGGVECPDGAGLTCVTTGNGPTWASAAWGGAGSAWSSAALSNVTELSQVACTSASSPTCVGVGSGPSGAVILTTSSDLGTTTFDSAPAGVSDISQVACPTANGCYAIGTTAGGPVLLAGAVGQTSPQQDTWAIVTPPSTTFTDLSSIVCPATAACELSGAGTVGTGPSAWGIIQVDGDPANLATTPGWTPTFLGDNLDLPSGVTVASIGTIDCPTSECLAIANVDDSTSPTDPTILSTTVTAGSASNWSNEVNFPTGAGSVTGLSCTSTTCVAIGTAAGTAAVWTGDLTATPDDWSQATGVPTSIAAVSSVACGNPATGDTADCVIAATTPGLSATGQLLEGSLTNGGWVWNLSAPPSGSAVTSYTGVACEAPPSSTQAICAAVGATAGGPVIATSSSGPSGTWTTETPSSLSGATVSGIPLEIAPSNTSDWTTAVAAGQASNATSLPGTLYPQPGGYSVAAGDCQAEATSTSAASLTASPGATGSVTVPLGVLPLQVVTAAGAPVSGATVTLTSTTCGAGPADQYTLPATDAYGISRTAVPYGTYSYTVAGSPAPPAGTTIEVGGDSVTVLVNSVPVATDYLPGPATVTS